MSRTLAVVPVRGSRGAKTRLSSIFSEQERARLVWRMTSRVLTAIDEAGSIDHVLIVTHEPDTVLNQVGQAPHYTVVLQPRARTGLNAAVELGRDWARAHGYDRMLALSADLPILDASDVRRAVNQRAPVVIAPDRHGTGTNALMLPIEATQADRPFAFRFGDQSCRYHLEEAHRLGLDVATIIAAGLQLDLDTPEDWYFLPPTTRDEMLATVMDHADALTGRHARQR